ncbi:hypothetical protein MBLNU13_g09032t2 [Cladosporium sp. NU13]
MICSVLCGLAHAIFLTLAWESGLGRHFDSLTEAQQQLVLKLTIAGVELFVIITTVFGRISFCVFLLYIISPTDTAKRRTLHGVIGVQVVANVVCLIQIYSQCGTKVEALWNFSVAASAHCHSPMVQTIVGYVQSALNSVCDVVLTILPTTILWSLQMPTAQKTGLGLVLTLSIFAFAASIAKCVAIGNLGKGDLTWYMVQLQIWCVVENNTFCLAASIPALRPLLRRSDAGNSHPYSYGTDDRRSKAHIRNRSSRGMYTQNSTLGQNHEGNSEEYILASVGAEGSDQIMKTTAVSVAFGPRDTQESGTVHERGTVSMVPAFLKGSQNV